MLRSRQDPKLPHVVQIPYDTLYHLLYVFTEKASKSGDWVAPLGILVTLATTYLISDFKDRFWLAADYWRLIVILSMFACAVWLSRALFQLRRVPTLDSLVQDIVAKSAKRDENRDLFLIKAPSEDNVMRFLVYRDPVWEAYFFLHVPFDPNIVPDASHMAGLRASVASYLGVVFDQVEVSHLEELDTCTSKVSDRTKLETFYAFRFWAVVLGCEIKNLRLRRFELGGTEFCWMTLAEMQAHSQTAKKNADVIDHLFNNMNTLAGTKHSTKEVIQIGTQRRTAVPERQSKGKNNS